MQGSAQQNIVLQRLRTSMLSSRWNVNKEILWESQHPRCLQFLHSDAAACGMPHAAQ